MYEFIDTIEPAGSNSLPSEAISINGQYIEDVIDGYRTLNVVGRELVTSELYTLEVGRVNGSIYQGKRIPAREITIQYQLLSDSAAEFRAKFNKLNEILNVEQAEVIFADEPTKYWTATKASVDDVPEGQKNVVGSFVLYCADPYKHALIVKQFEAEENEDGILEAVVENTGNVAVPIDFEITHNHENGYIGIASEYGAMQYGDVSESDTAMSETVINWKKATEMTYSDTTNTALFKSNYQLNGNLHQYSANNRVYLEYNPNNPGGTGWHGGAVRMNIPDWPATGQKQIKNFKVTGHLWFARTKATQTGAFDFNLLAGNTIIFGFQMWHDSDTKGYICFYAGSTKSKTYRPNATSFKTGSPGGTFTLEKSQGTFRFAMGDCGWSIKIDSMEEQYIDGIAIAITQKKGRGYSLMPWICFDQIRVRADIADRTIDVPNRYPDGSVFTVDGLTRIPYLDGIPAVKDEVTGTKYFLVPPGETQVQFLHSDFSDPAPSCVARIREAWL